MRIPGILLASLLLAGPASAAVFLPPVTTKCFTQLDDPIADGGVTVCVDWGRAGCAAWVSREYVWGRETTCLASWPDVLA